MGDIIDFRVVWPDGPPNSGHPLLDDSLGRLSIQVGDDTATRYRTHHGAEGDQLLIPTYHIAEWFASNWWPLLFEPAKMDDYENDVDFRARHWLGAARNGFALPDLWFCPAGGKIEISGDATDLVFSRLRFLDGISKVVETQVFQDALRRFVRDVVERLNNYSHTDTLLHEIWELITKTPPEAERYCQLTGALGISPYDERPEIDTILNTISERLPSDMVSDLCETSDETTFDSLSALTIEVVETLGAASEVNLANLLTVPVPPDNDRYAWQRGREAASIVRKHFRISNADPESGERFFAKIGFDPRASSVAKGSSQIRGALQRGETTMQLAILDERKPQQRFSAARGTFLGWIAETNGSRLVTTAITRDQQASRAFAAELIAPIHYIRTKAKNKLLSEHGVQEIAESLSAPVGAVAYQARHGGIYVAKGFSDS